MICAAPDESRYAVHRILTLSAEEMSFDLGNRMFGKVFVDFGDDVPLHVRVKGVP